MARKLQRPTRARHAQQVADAPPEPPPQAAIDTVLDQLQRDGWLDDRRAAGSMARTKGSQLGARRLGQLMRERGFDTDLVADTVSEARPSDAAHAQALWQRRFGRRAEDPRERARQVRFLLARGFEAELVIRIVDAKDLGAADERASPISPD